MTHDNYTYYEYYDMRNTNNLKWQRRLETLDRRCIGIQRRYMNIPTVPYFSKILYEPTRRNKCFVLTHNRKTHFNNCLITNLCALFSIFLLLRFAQPMSHRRLLHQSPYTCNLHRGTILTPSTLYPSSVSVRCSVNTTLIASVNLNFM